MTTYVHSTVTFSVPEEALREGEEQFESEMTEWVEWKFDIPVEATIALTNTTSDESGDETTAHLTADFRVPDESTEEAGEAAVLETIQDDLESLFQVPVTVTVEMAEDT